MKLSLIDAGPSLRRMLAPLVVLGGFAAFAGQPTETGQAAAPSLPPVTGQTIEGKAVSLPGELKGKSAVLGFVFSQKAQKDLETWMQPAWDMLISPPQGVFSAGAFDGRVYLVLMPGPEAARLLTSQYKGRAQQKLDKDLQRHIVVSSEASAAVRQSLSVKDDGKPYFAALNEEGVIVKVVSGTYSDDKMEALLDALEGDE